MASDSEELTFIPVANGSSACRKSWLKDDSRTTSSSKNKDATFGFLNQTRFSPIMPRVPVHEHHKQDRWVQRASSTCWTLPGMVPYTGTENPFMDQFYKIPLKTEVLFPLIPLPKLEMNNHAVPEDFRADFNQYGRSF